MQGVDEVDAAGELISVIWTSTSSAVKRVLTFGLQMQAKKHRVHEISTFLRTLPPADPPIRFRRIYAGPQYATPAYWRRRDTIRTIRTYVRLIRTNGNAGQQERGRVDFEGG